LRLNVLITAIRQLIAQAAFRRLNREASVKALILTPAGNEKPEPAWFSRLRGYVPHDQPGELFNLSADSTERYNRYAERPEVVRQLAARLEAIKQGQRQAAE
jgi:hypothetical protein